MRSLIPRRFHIAGRWVKDYVQGRARHAPPREMLTFLLQGRGSRRGLKFIDKIEDAGEFLAVTFRGLEGTLYWPKEDPISHLSMIIDEQLEPSNWHAYFGPETQLQPEDVALDCGASEGLFTFLNYRKCRHIITVEPNPIYVRALNKTFGGNEKVSVAGVALGSHSGRANLTLRGISSSVETEGEGGTPVEIRRIDDLVKESGLPVSFIKADLEGFEMKVLEGARETIVAHKPRIAITTYHNADHPREIAEFLRQLVPSYQTRLAGYTADSPAVMLHAWVPR